MLAASLIQNWWQNLLKLFPEKYNNTFKAPNEHYKEIIQKKDIGEKNYHDNYQYSLSGGKKWRIQI